MSDSISSQLIAAAVAHKGSVATVPPGRHYVIAHQPEDHQSAMTKLASVWGQDAKGAAAHYSKTEDAGTGLTLTHATATPKAPTGFGS